LRSGELAGCCEAPRYCRSEAECWGVARGILFLLREFIFGIKLLWRSLNVFADGCRA
jgi:hypothetical protein